MKYTIHSTIEYEYRECSEMKDEKEPIIEHDSSGVLKEKSDSPDGDGARLRHRSEAHSDQNKFFHRVRVEKNGVSQITNVNVNIQPDKDDPCTGCFKAMAKMFK
jgi:hypothetical protein